MKDSEDAYTIAIENVVPWENPMDGPGTSMIIETNRGEIKSIIHNDEEKVTKRAVIWVCGAGGGFAGPANGAYEHLSERLKPTITSLRLDYRMPNVLPECVLDTLAGVSFLSTLGHSEIALVGHSFGGAVVIVSGSLHPSIKTIIALSSQTYGASNVASLAPKPLLLVHGSDDTRLTPRCSEQIYEWAEEPKELKILSGAEHGLLESREELLEILETWITSRLEV